MDQVINMNNVSWRREGKEILHHIDWHVNKQEHWAVLGLNGAGKTSLLNMVNGYIWPTTGDVSVLGNRFGNTDILQLRKSIGWVSASLGQRINERHPSEEIVISGKYASVGLVFEEPTEADKEKAFQLMKQLFVDHVIGQPYAKCSQGERQKILIARALMADPQLLILDEPTTGLDFISREDLLATIEEFARKPDAPTMIFVTHHIEEILPIFSHTLLLGNGTVYAQGERKNMLTSEKLSDLYGRNIRVSWEGNRAWMSLLDVGVY